MPIPEMRSQEKTFMMLTQLEPHTNINTNKRFRLNFVQMIVGAATKVYAMLAALCLHFIIKLFNRNDCGATTPHLLGVWISVVTLHLTQAVLAQERREREESADKLRQDFSRQMPASLMMMHFYLRNYFWDFIKTIFLALNLPAEQTWSTRQPFVNIRFHNI